MQCKKMNSSSVCNLGLTFVPQPPLVLLQTSAATTRRWTPRSCSGPPSQKKRPGASCWVTSSSIPCTGRRPGWSKVRMGPGGPWNTTSPEEHLRADCHHLSLKTVTLIADVTVSPDVNRHTLKGLESGTPYQVRISGFTQTGVGVQSKAIAFTTDNHGYILSSDSKFPLRKLILTGFNSFSSS